MSNYRHGWRRPAWRGGTPGRELTEQEEKVLHRPPFFNPKLLAECKPSSTELGYYLTGREEEGPSAKKPFSDKYLRVHNKKYQPLALRPRYRKNRYLSYYVVYPKGKELPKPSTMEEAAKTTCVFYPDQPNLLLKAPLNLADPRYAEKRRKAGPSDRNEGHALFAFLKTYPTLCEKILTEVGYLGIAALSQSCKLGLETVSGMMCMFDLATGDFANSEYTVLEHETLCHYREAVSDDIPHGYRVLQVSSGHLGFDRMAGYQRQPKYEKLAQGIVRLTRSFHLWGSSVEHLYLTKVPFMDVKVLGMWLKEMPNLKTLTILRCEHIRLFDMVPLLDMVNEHRKSGSELKLDVAPFYELGPRNANFEGDPLSFEENLRPSNDRKGTFGVTFGDPGVKIHAAVVEYLFYELLPKLEATDQMYLMSLDSLLRNFFERLPLPEHATLRTLKAYEGARKWFNKVEAHLRTKVAEAGENEETAQGDTPENTTDDTHDTTGNSSQEIPASDEQESDQTVKRPEFQDPSTLPEELQQEEAWERIRCYMMLAYAAFGSEDPHLQVAADSAMSSNAPLRLHNFGKWGEDVSCSSCHFRMPCMFFPTACICDKDRLEAFCVDERNHLTRFKKRVIEKLGCGYNYEPVRGLEDTNIDFTRLNDLSDASRAQLHSDFDDRLDDPDSALHAFYNAARDMDVTDPGGHRGRKQNEQLPHDYSGHSLANVTMDDQMSFISYRRGYTVEDFTVNKRGMHARNTAQDSQF